MVALVTRDEVKSQLMVDNDAVDPWIDMMILAISGAVITWLKDEWRAYEPMVDSNGDAMQDSDGANIPAFPLTALPVVKAATLVEIASQFRFRDGEGVSLPPSNWGHGYVLSTGPTSLLSGLRRSTVA